MIRGERFELDLDDDDDPNTLQPPVQLPAAFVGDVLERKPAAPKPPSAPSLKSKGGFPEHRKRNVESRFKQKKAATSQTWPSDAVSPPANVSVPKDAPRAQPSGKAKSWEEEEKGRIDLENRQRLADMSPAEIEEERRELMSNLSPAFLQKLLQRSNVETGSEEVDLSTPVHQPEQRAMATNPKPAKTVKFEEPEPSTMHEPKNEHPDEAAEALPHDSVHFPRPPQPPSLDPSSETFFEDLHEKYFPSLPSDPDKLEWMQSSSAGKSTYDPGAAAFNASEIRFNFQGELLAPKTASEIPVTHGLHHHGDAPDAAGYTVGELAHLSRSSYPAQRCIAFQTLGRILYRLSKGEFGDSAEPGEQLDSARDTFGELARGLWREVERLQVIPMLVDESEGNGVDGGRHVSAKAYATEAVWLWRKGGGRRWKAA